MLFRTVDANGDMMPIQRTDQLSEGPDAVAGAVDSALAMLHGEWWEDENLGFQVPEFLKNTVRTHGTGMLTRYISQYISGIQGVMGVVSVNARNVGREYVYDATILTENGSVRMEVRSDGILRAVY